MKRKSFSLIFILVATFVFSTTVAAYDPLKKPLDTARQSVQVVLMDQEFLEKTAKHLSEALAEKKDTIVIAWGKRAHAEMILSIENQEIAERNVIRLYDVIFWCSLSTGCSNNRQLAETRIEARQLQHTLTTIPEISGFEDNLKEARQVLLRSREEEKQQQKLPIRQMYP